MLNLHASGGETMMRAARDAVAGFDHPPLVIGVTILTSHGDADLGPIGFAGTARENAVRLARLARESGLDGVVCSAQEAPAMREAAGNAFVLVTPGIRLASDAKGDQSRTVTPPQAARLGADFLVIGRPITQSKDPVATLMSIRASLQETDSA
jgi:orotidine-5'-phosphate decarboxylase